MLGIKKGESEAMSSRIQERTEGASSVKASPGVVQGAFWTVLMRAASSGDIETVRRLALDGVEVNAQSPNGTTPLIAAVKNGHSETAFELIELGADLSIADSDGMTAVEWARKKGQPMLVKGLEELATKAPGNFVEAEAVSESEGAILQ
jgi:ankyrin repeat protein